MRDTSRRCVVALVLACQAVLACGGETRERPVAPSALRSEAIKPSGLPLPVTAFKAESAASTDDAGTNEPEDRFATRRIGEDESSPANQSRRAVHGRPVDLDLMAADLHDVFRLLADVGKVNVVVGSDVSGKVTMRLRQVPWDQAFDVIARAHGLVYERQGDVILVRSSK